MGPNGTHGNVYGEVFNANPNATRYRQRYRSSALLRYLSAISALSQRYLTLCPTGSLCWFFSTATRALLWLQRRRLSHSAATNMANKHIKPH
jgi:hypothetical protein